MTWQSIQESWFLVVNEFARSTPWLHAPMRLYAQWGVALFAAVLLLAWWWARRDSNPQTMAAALWAPAGALLAIGLNQPLGSFVQEPRPYTVLPHVLVLVAHSQDFSFPSDHAVMAGAVATGVLLTHRRLGTATALAAMVLAFARVYVGAHYPLDVIAGLLFGAAVRCCRQRSWLPRRASAPDGGRDRPEQHRVAAAADHYRHRHRSMIADVASHMLGLPAWVALLVVFALPALESSAFVGFIFPGEVALILGGVMAYEGTVSLSAVLACGVAGAIVGDSVGYAVGRRHGRRLLDGTVGRFVKSGHLDRAETYLAERGGRAVFFGRFTAALRVLIPGLAGMSGLRYRTFVTYNVAGALVWGTLSVMLGYLGGSSWQHVEHVASRIGLAALALVVIAALGGVLLRRTGLHGSPDSPSASRPALRSSGLRQGSRGPPPGCGLAWIRPAKPGLR